MAPIRSKDVEKAAGKLLAVLARAHPGWLHVVARRDMPVESQRAAARSFGEFPTITATHAVAWWQAVGATLAQEYQRKRGRRSTATIGLTAFVRFTQGAYRELFNEEPKIGTATEAFGHDDADGGRQRFKGRDSPFIRFMRATARHLAVQVRADDPEIAAALRRWTKGDTLADKARSLPREHFAKNS